MGEENERTTEDIFITKNIHFPVWVPFFFVHTSFRRSFVLGGSRHSRRPLEERFRGKNACCSLVVPVVLCPRALQNLFVHSASSHLFSSWVGISSWKHTCLFCTKRVPSYHLLCRVVWEWLGPSSRAVFVCRKHRWNLVSWCSSPRGGGAPVHDFRCTVLSAPQVSEYKCL